MSAAPTLPLTRKVAVDRLPPAGETVRIVATPEECEALARDFKIPAVLELTGLYTLTGNTRRVHVAGRVTGRVTRTCVVTLEDFEAPVDEEVDLEFAEPKPESGTPEEDARRAIDPPDEIVDGRIDLGALTAEFLALGLDPYPRKPGVSFEEPPEDAEAPSPFAALSRLKSDK